MFSRLVDFQNFPNIKPLLSKTDPRSLLDSWQKYCIDTVITVYIFLSADCL